MQFFFFRKMVKRAFEHTITLAISVIYAFYFISETGVKRQ